MRADHSGKMDFSTHILTRRMTKTSVLYIYITIFSTHILTRRMTILVKKRHLLLFFQLTSSQGGWLIAMDCNYPDCFFQLTSSQGGWRLWSRIQSQHYLFNSHPHKEDDAPTAQGIVCSSFFNSHPHKEDDAILPEYFNLFSFSTHILTRRMTSSLNADNVKVNFFNSHPHKEDDTTWQNKRQVL